MLSIVVLVSISAFNPPQLTFCEIQANYVDSVVEEAKKGRTLLHASLMELSKTGAPGIAERLYKGVSAGEYSTFTYSPEVEDIAREIESECNN